MTETPKIPDQQKPKELKCIVIGSSATGKTSIINRLINNEFHDDTQSTIGVEFNRANINLNGLDVTLKVWDTAGQERFRSIAKPYYRDAVCVLLVFDITNKRSFDDLSAWWKDVSNLCSPDASIILVGNKTDLTSKRIISSPEAEQFAEMLKIQYIETSALTGDNVRDAFVRSATEAVSRLSKVDHVEENKTIVINEKKNCCF